MSCDDHAEAVLPMTEPEYDEGMLAPPLPPASVLAVGGAVPLNSDFTSDSMLHSVANVPLSGPSTHWFPSEPERDHYLGTLDLLPMMNVKEASDHVPQHGIRPQRDPPHPSAAKQSVNRSVAFGSKIGPQQLWEESGLFVRH